MTPIVSIPDHDEANGILDGKPIFNTPRFQLYLDDITLKINELIDELVTLQASVSTNATNIATNTTNITNNDTDITTLNNKVLGNAILLTVYTVSTLPAVGTNGLIHVSDETGGPTAAYSDATNWRRVADGAVVS